jgi:hypothetical protein
MMILVNTVQAAVVPAAGREGWFELTGNDITVSEHADSMSAIEDAEERGLPVHRHARIVTMHDSYDCADKDPRFNGESDGLYTVIENAGFYTLYLDVNIPEFALLSKLMSPVPALPRKRQFQR